MRWARTALLATIVAPLIATAPAVARWSAPIDLSDYGEQNAGDAAIAMNAAGDTVVVWRRGAGSSGRIRAATRPAGGGFGAPATISPSGANAQSPRVAIDGAGGAIVVWASTRGTRSRVIASARPAGGGFGRPIAVSAPAGKEIVPQVAMNAAGEGIVAWARYDGRKFVVQAASRPAAGDFAAATDLSGPLNQLAQAVPHVMATPVIDAAGNALVVWENRSADGGVVEAAAQAPAGAFGPVMALSSGPESYDPAVATSAAGETVVAWHGRSPDGENLTVRARIRPPGASFGEVADLSPPNNDVYGPSVAVGLTGEAVVAWSPEEYDGTPGRSFAALRPPGGSFAAPVMLAVKRQPAFDPTVVAGAGGAFAATWTSPGDHVGIGAAIRPPGGQFSATAIGPGGVAPDVGVDGRGQAITVWQLESESAPSVQAAGLDAAGRALRNGLPMLRGLRVAASRVRAAHSGAPFALGTGSVRFVLDAPARVVLAIEHATSGRRSVIDTCDRQTRSNRRRPPCVRYVLAGRQTLAVPGGAVRLRFSGRIAGRALAPGRYRLVAVPSIAGRRGNTAREVFSIVR